MILLRYCWLLIYLFCTSCDKTNSVEFVSWNVFVSYFNTIWTTKMKAEFVEKEFKCTLRKYIVSIQSSVFKVKFGTLLLKIDVIRILKTARRMLRKMSNKRFILEKVVIYPQVRSILTLFLHENRSIKDYCSDHDYCFITNYIVKFVRPIICTHC